MKSAKELFERLKTDKEFAKQFNDLVQAKRASGANNYYDIMIPAAAELGYELTREALDEMIKQNSEEISEEELGTISGGFCVPVWIVTALAATSIGATGGLAYITINKVNEDQQ